MPSWFGNGKERYWVVDESKQSVQSALLKLTSELDDSDDDGENGSYDTAISRARLMTRLYRILSIGKSKPKSGNWRC
jgi:hypothetical protein